jgi:hypothetical protein
MAIKTDKKVDKTGLIEPADLPQGILDTLSCSQIRTLGYYLFEQLRDQRDFTMKQIKEGNQSGAVNGINKPSK